MSATTSHTQARTEGRRFAAADPELMELQDANEEGTALHLDIRRLVNWIDQVDEELDLIAVERAQLHRRERRANRLLDQIRMELRRLNDHCLGIHRDAGQRGCEIQQERSRARGRAAAHVLIETNHGTVEVRS